MAQARERDGLRRHGAGGRRREVLLGMDAWKRLGGFIGGHMAFVSPACVALGVLLPGPLGALRPAVTALLPS